MGAVWGMNALWSVAWGYLLCSSAFIPSLGALPRIATQVVVPAVHVAA